MSKDPLHDAARTWDRPDESIESVARRIHEGASGEEALQKRANDHVHSLFNPFPYARLVPQFRAMEIGSGLGYIMEALALYAQDKGIEPKEIIGLDIAPGMIAKARQRMTVRPPFEFLHYDGVHVPKKDHLIDLIYSVAALPHIPKPYVYNLFFEIRRLLSDSGFALLHFIGFRHIPNSSAPWKNIVRHQVAGETAHWLHFYSTEELRYVLREGTGFAHVDVTEIGDAIYVCLGNSKLLA